MKTARKFPMLPDGVARVLARFCDDKNGRPDLQCFHFDPADGGTVAATDGKRLAVVPVPVSGKAWAADPKTCTERDVATPKWQSVLPKGEPMQTFLLHVDMIPFLRTVDKLADDVCLITVSADGLAWGKDGADRAEWLAPTGVSIATDFQARFFLDLFALAAVLDPAVTVLRCEQFSQQVRGETKPVMIRVKLAAGAFALVMPFK